tara:strand:- start:600 stop:722 length:123 start_codon:yes stop_codon:yes gene_type:complete
MLAVRLLEIKISKKVSFTPLRGGCAMEKSDFLKIEYLAQV